MAVRIPRLDPIEASGGDLPSGQRINIKSKDQASSILQRSKETQSLVGAGLKAYEQVQEQKIAQIGNQNDRHFNQWHELQLKEKSRITEGDPTDAYNQFEKDTDEKIKEILNRRPNLSDRVKDSLARKMAKTKNDARVQMLTQRGSQVEAYRSKEYTSNLKTKRSKLTINANNVRSNQKGVFDEQLDDIKTTIAMRALETGGATLLPEDAKSASHTYRDSNDKEVKVKWGPISQRQVDEELSEGVSESLKNLVDAGEVAQAGIVFKKHEKLLTAEQKSKYQKSIKEKNKDGKALIEVARIEGLPDEDKINALEKIKHPDTKRRATDIINSNEQKMTAMKKRRSAVFNDEVLKRMEQMQKAGGLNNMSDIESDIFIKNRWDKLSGDQQRNIRQTFKPVNVTSTAARVKHTNLVLGNDPNFDIYTMTPEQYSEYTLDMSKSDKKTAWKDFTRIRSIKNITPAEQRSVFNRANDMLETQLFLDDHITKNKYGSYDGNNARRLGDATKKMITYFSEYMQGGVPNEKEMDAFVKRFSKAVIDEKVKGFTPPTREVTPLTRRATGQPLLKIEDFGLTFSQKIRLRNLYKEKTGLSGTYGNQEYLQFIKDNKEAAL